MGYSSGLEALFEQAKQDPLMEMFLLTAIDQYAQSLAELSDEEVRQVVLEGSPRKSQSGINATAWRTCAVEVKTVLQDAYGADDNL